MRLLGAATLGLAGVVLLALGLVSGPARLRPGDPSFVNADRPGINAHNSPTVAAARNRVVVANRIDTPRFSCAVSLSTTGGATWKQLDLPLPPDAPNCHQPDVAFGGDGELLVLYTATGGQYNQPVGVWLQRFAGETAAGPAVRVAPAEAFHARMAVDGRQVWVTWVQAEGAAQRPLGWGTTPAPLRMARSVDLGRTFGPPQTVSEGRRVVQPTPVTLGGGRVVVGALDLGDDRMNYEALHGGQGGDPPEGRWWIVTWSSSDEGATFGAPVLVSRDIRIPARIIVNLAPAPGFVRDLTVDGRLYAAWDAGRGDERDVFLARSDDSGATWTAPVVVAHRPRGQFLPGLGVSSGGRVDLVFYDRSDDPDDVRASVTMASSHDAGRTFRTATVSDAPFDSRIGFGSLQGIPLLGSRLAVLSEPDTALAFWSDTGRGRIDDNVQDLAVVTVDVEEAGRRRPALIVLGLLLLGLGLGGSGLAALVARLRPGGRGPQEA